MPAQGQQKNQDRQAVEEHHPIPSKRRVAIFSHQREKCSPLRVVRARIIKRAGEQATAFRV